MTNSDTAIRELQRKYAMKTYRLNPETIQREQTGYDVNFMIDLTALISEHYYPKEFVEWISNEKGTLSGTYDYWDKNIRKENEQ